MASILQELAGASRARVAASKEATPLAEMRAQAAAPAAPSFADALAGPEMAFICECKKASPSKGVIAERFPYREIARDYETAGAAAISCLTEPTRFLGHIDYLREIAADVRIPVLRKDFIVDEYQILEARAAGAAAVLLICSILSPAELSTFQALALDLGMDALVEAHDEREIEMALASGARIVGVNNRNLADFTVDFGNSIRLRELVPAEVLFVTESGVKTAADVALLREAGVDAVLVGETLMRAPDKRAALDELRGGAR